MADATREDVLAWMAANGKGYKLAAAHFGLPVERVKKWRQRARQAAAASQGDTGGHLHVLPKPSASSPKPPTARPPPRPPATKVARNGRVTLSSEALDDVSAGLLRQTGLRLLRYSAGEPSPEEEALLESLTENQADAGDNADAVAKAMGMDAG